MMQLFRHREVINHTGTTGHRRGESEKQPELTVVWRPLVVTRGTNGFPARHDSAYMADFIPSIHYD